MFEGQPKGLYALALANTGERFGYYTMLAIFVLFLRANFDLSASTAGNIYAAFLALVYFLPFIGGILADKFGYGKMVTFGIIGMFVGYVLLALPLGSGAAAWVSMVAGLLVISTGTGLFKGNLQVMVGNLYDDPAYASKRDSAFSIFYMAINIGALFAPTAAVEIMEYAQQTLPLVWLVCRSSCPWPSITVSGELSVTWKALPSRLLWRRKPSITRNCLRVKQRSVLWLSAWCLP